MLFPKNIIFIFIDMNEEVIHSTMVNHDKGYFIVDVMSMGCGKRYWVKYSIDDKWEQRNFYKPNRVISFYRSLKKAGLIVCEPHGQNPYTIPGELQSLLQL